MGLPRWLKKDETRPGYFIANPDRFYPALLKAFESHNDIPYNGEVDAYWLEVAYQCMKLEVQRSIVLEGIDPRPLRGLNIHVTSNTIKKGKTHKDRWGLVNHNPGRFVEYEKLYGAKSAWRAVASDARKYYLILRGVLPQ